MDEYECYVKIIKSILKYNIKYDILIPIFLNKMYYEYYMNRNDKEYNLDDLYKNTYPFYIYVLIKNI